jgi:hypothetical protein
MLPQNLNVMNLLWAFNFDTNGNLVPVDIFAYEQVGISFPGIVECSIFTCQLVQGSSTAPEPFKCRITPRTAAKARIIEQEFLEAADTFSKFEFGLSPEDKEFVARSRAHAL